MRTPVLLIIFALLLFGCKENEKTYLLKSINMQTSGNQVPEIQDILFYNGNEYISYDKIEWTGVFSQLIHKLLDGNPETVFKSQSIYADIVMDLVPITAMVIRTENPESLEGCFIEVRNFRSKTIENVCLGDINKLKKAAGYKFDFNTKEFTPVDKFPKVAEKAHSSPVDYIEGVHYTFENSIPGNLKMFAEYDYSWGVKDKQLQLEKEDHKIKDAGRITLHETLSPGKTVAVDIHMGYQDNASKIEQSIEIGELKFVLKDANSFETPDGKLFNVKSSYKPSDEWYSIVISRGEDEDSNSFAWAVCGNNHNSKGTYKHSQPLPENLPVAFGLKTDFNWVWWNADAQLLDITMIKSISIGDLQKSFSNLRTIKEDYVFDRSSYKKKVFEIRNLADKKLPELVLEKGYGLMSDSEFNLIKSYILAQKFPKSNINNCVTFGAAQDLRGIRDVLHMRYDEDLLLAMANWATSIYDYRNGGPHYSYYALSEEIWNADKYPVPKDYVAPMWPHFGGMFSIHGNTYVRQDVTSTASGLAALMYYSEYVVSHKDLWNKEITLYSGRKVKCLDLASEYISFVEQAIEDFVKPNYIDEETYRLERPWNRYSQLIETFNLLINSYDVLKERVGNNYAEKRKYANNVINAYLEYFFDEEQNFTPDTIKTNGTVYAVADTRYAPKWRKWGAESEDLGHGIMEYGDFYYLYKTGRYSKYLNPGSLRVFANNFYHRMFKGYYDSGQPILSDHYNGKGKEAGIWILAPSHVWTSIFKPELYHHFVDFLAFNEYNGGRIANYAFLLKLRQDMYNMGYKNKAGDKVFRVNIVANEQEYGIGQEINLKPEATAEVTSYSWDFDEDGVEDSTDDIANYNYKKPGIYVVSVKATNKAGKEAYGFKTFVVD